MATKIDDKDLPGLYQCCYNILEQYPESRDCNMALFHYFYKHYFDITDTEILKNKAIDLPKSNSIERAARDVQADGFFTPSRYVENYRSKKRDMMEDYYGHESTKERGEPRANYKDRSWKEEQGLLKQPKTFKPVVTKTDLKKIEKEWVNTYDKETTEGTEQVNNWG